MNFLEAFVLGLVQGLGEFLPISSSGHLVLVPWVFGWRDQGLSFDIALHLGTLAAVLMYFRNDILILAGAFWRSLLPSSRNLHKDSNQRLAWLLILASVPGAIAGKLLEEKAETAFRNPLIVAASLGVFGLILLISDRFASRVKTIENMGWLDALLIGCSQALAVIPGVSRSGSTIAAGLGLSYQRESAARFSFLMSIPIIAGACIVKLKDLRIAGNHGALAIGFLTSALFGLLSINFLLRYVSKHDLSLFVIYRLFIAAAVVTLFYMRNSAC